MSNERIANRYALGTLIGQGGMGEVYLGQDMQTGQPVAIKLLNLSLHDQPDAVERFEREGEALRSLDHPNVVKLLAMEWFGTRRCLVLEYVEGGSLETTLSQQPRMPLQQALRLIIDLADALARVHQLGLLHRDIKPSNILIDPAGVPHLTDFGIASLSDASSLTPSGAVLGTYAYLSPEACAGEKLDGRTDIWSLGVVLYEMLIGSRPFEGNSPAAVIGAVMYRPLPDIRALRPDLSEGMATLLLRMLTRQRDERLGSARLVAATAEALLRGDPRPLPPLPSAQVNTLSEEDRQHLDDLLNIHRRNVKVLERKVALFGANVPLDVQNQIDMERERVLEIEQQLGISTQPSAAATTTSSQVKTNLPIAATMLIGRAKEIVAAQNQLRDSSTRLLTLIGPGGCGKTRLALDVAAGLIDEFPDGAWFVNLVAVTSHEQVSAAIATALNLKEEPGAPFPIVLRNYLREKSLLLLLDTFEHVLNAAGLIAELLAACPSLKVLATSRAKLDISAESEFFVPPLALPTKRQATNIELVSRTPAVALFIRAAQSVRPSFALKSDNTPAVIELCTRLDGLPLAIELAAVQCKLLSPQQLVQRLNRRFDVLKSSSRDLTTRQQTLRNTIDWSYNLLEPGAQSLLARLAVFVGGCSFDQVELICADPALPPLESDSFEGISALVDSSFIRQFEDENGDPRFAMMETIREYASERLVKLGIAADLGAGHAAFFENLAAEAEPNLTGPEQQQWITQLKREHDNIRVALTWLLANDPARAVAMAASLWRFWYVCGLLSEGRKWIERALAAASGRVPPEASARALNGVGGIAWAQGDFAAATTYQQQALALFEQLGDKGGMARALNVLGVIARGQQNYEQAKTYYQQSLDIAQAAGDQWAIANIQSNLGVIFQNLGEYPQALAQYEQSLHTRRMINDMRGVSISLFNVAEVMIALQDYAGAQAHLAENIGISQQIHNDEGIARALEQLGKIAALQQRAVHAATIWGAVSVIREEIRTPLPPREQADLNAAMTAARALVTPEDFEQAWQHGQQLDRDAAIAFAAETTL